LARDGKLPTRGRFFLWQIVFQIRLAFSGDSDRLTLGLALAAAGRRPAQHIDERLPERCARGLFLVFVLIAAVVTFWPGFLVPIMVSRISILPTLASPVDDDRPEKGRYAVYLLLKLVLSIAAAFCSASSRPPRTAVSSCALAWWRHTAGWVGASHISLAIIVGTLLLLVFITCRFGVRAATVSFPPMRCTFLPLVSALDAL